MKTKLWSILLFCFVITGFSQAVGDVGINTNTPHASSVLDLTSNNKGLLVPRLTTTAINDLSAIASEGLIVFDKDRKLFVGWDGIKWITLGAPLVSNTSEQTLASWEVNGLSNYGPAVFHVTQMLNDIVSSAMLERGTNLSTTGAAVNNTWGATGWVPDFQTAIDQDRVVTVTLNFLPGKTISLNRIAPHVIRRSGTGPKFAQYQFSRDGGLTYTDIGSPIDLSVTTAAGNYLPEISLRPYLDLQTLDTTQTPTLIFRIVNYDASNINNGKWYIANIAGPDFQLIADVIN